MVLSSAAEGTCCPATQSRSSSSKRLPFMVIIVSDFVRTTGRAKILGCAVPRVLHCNLGRDRRRWLGDIENSSWAVSGLSLTQSLQRPNCRRGLGARRNAIECARLPTSCTIEQRKGLMHSQDLKLLELKMATESLQAVWWLVQGRPSTLESLFNAFSRPTCFLWDHQYFTRLVVALTSHITSCQTS